jgi:hypothetical protein
MYVSMMDSAWYATKNIGMLITNDIPPWDLESLLDQTPQVSYEGEDFLDDKIEWVKIEGSFVANGGERYLTIGNFDDDAHTDTLFVPGGGIPPSFSEEYWASSYYYIDGVSLIPDSIYLGNDELSIENEELSIYPNPATENLTIETRNWQGRELMLLDATGRVILQQSLDSSSSKMNTRHLPRGVYVVVLQERGVVVGRRRLVLL